ncbi:class I adenylate-forming enzyme family protein [Natrinema soli]|uniref:Class I adenylate-forming enzyme family protein n=1 Tax=Natrinema soli TaxID=1930624 RepID=A0ABD5SHC6_9EURY|nr:class I adenylate-forming enzyme family protein [Natrinema soli]
MHGKSPIESQTLAELSSIAAENNPKTTAFADPDRRLTWAEYDRESVTAANAFQQYISQGDRVAFLCGSSVNHAVALNGVFKAGGIPSNFHVRASPNTLAYCIETIRPRVLVVDEEYAQFFEERVYENIDGERPTVLNLGTPQADYEQSLPSIIADQTGTEPDVRVEAADIAAVWWTSGTTGRPKAWCHTHEGILYKGHKRTISDDRLTRRLLVLSPGFASWWNNFINTMLSSGTAVFRPEWDPEDIVALIEEEELTLVTLVTTMWREILKLDTLDEYDLSSLQKIVSTGEKMDLTTLERLQNNICDNVHNGYASTEVLGTTISSAEMEGDRIESVGQPILGQQVRVIEEGASPQDTVKAEETGEIIIKGPDAPVWAWGNSEKTEAEFEEGWWYSGDLGYKDEGGYLYLEGRSDFMITSKGMKVFPTPVEERLNAHPSVEEAAIVGVEDDEYGERVTALVYRLDATVDENELDEWCLASDDLARFERPRTYHFIDDGIPRTASGKLDRRTAKQQYLD